MPPEIEEENLDKAVDSVADDVANAYASLEEGDDDSDQSSDDDTGDNVDGSNDDNGDAGDSDSDDSSDDDAGSDDSGANASAETGTGDGETGDDDSEEAGDDENETSAQSASVPDHWSAPDKEMFSKQTPEAQEFLMRRHKEMEGHFTKQAQENAEAIRSYEPIAQVMAPFKQAMAAKGLNEGQVIQLWAAAENMLNKDPEYGIRQLAQTYKVDLVALAGSQDDGSDPYDTTKTASNQPSQEFVNLQNEVSTMRQSFTTQAQQEAVNKIEAFANEADDQGNLKRPFFKELEGDIAQIAAVARAQGKPIDLQSFYEQAAWSNPSTREKLQSSQRSAEETQKKAQEKKRADEKRKKASKAKKAASTVKSSTDVNAGGGGADNKNASLGADVAAAYDKAAGDLV